MEGPYRDLGSGFARITGVEGVRRSPSPISTVENALLELLRNARDAGAQNIYVASTLRNRRYRALTVLDDGHGIPAPYEGLIFDPGVTSRHLAANGSYRSGLSLYHIKKAALSLNLLSPTAPTSFRAIFDTNKLPERSLQSGTRSSGSNLISTLQTFLIDREWKPKPGSIYYGPQAKILAKLIENRIIHENKEESQGLTERLWRRGRDLGLDVSLRTVQRIRNGEIPAAESISEGGSADRGRVWGNKKDVVAGEEGARLDLRAEEMSGIAAILGEAARSRYLEIGDLKIEARPGEIVLRSRIYEPEEEYE
ncbi:MAG: ATP-binding protein [Rubrobacteraceae bacterium]